ncbi:MAG: hypothetical protein AABW48_06340 [Nanoarchaeota archaeon]
MKKVVIGTVLILILVLVVGCVNLSKPYGAPQKEADSKLLDEIAQIEEELNSVETVEEKLDAAEPLTGAAVTDIADAEEVEVKDTEVNTEVILPDLEESKEVQEESEDEIQVITVDENELIKLMVKVDDPDQDKVTYSFSRPLSKEGEWQTSYGDAGEYMVTLTATDGVLTTEKKLRVVVNRVNVAPVIGEVKSLQVQEGDTVTFEPVVTDPNNDPVTVTLSEPLKGGVYVADYASAGDYEIEVLASDGELETKKTFKLTILNVNQLPEINNIEDIAVKEGEIVKLEPEIVDLDGDEVTLSISEPVGKDGIWETGYTDHGEYLITVTADDGKDTVTKEIRVSVEDVNMPPEFVEVSLAVN